VRWADLLDGLNRVRRLHVESDGLSGQRLDEDLHGAAAQPQHEVEGRLLLNVVVGQRAPVLQLLAGEDQALLVRRDALLVLNLLLEGKSAPAAAAAKKGRDGRVRGDSNQNRLKWRRATVGGQPSAGELS
jgi:hypothetical protein